MEVKVCTVCDIEKPETEYNWQRQRGKERRAAHCKACQRERDKLPKYRLTRLRIECRNYKIECSLTVEQYESLVSKPCHYCGDSLAEMSGRALDRVDRSHGYHFDNVVPCCWLCNNSKGTTFNEREMKEIGALFKGFKERRMLLGELPLQGPSRLVNRTPKYWDPTSKRPDDYVRIKKPRQLA